MHTMWTGFYIIGTSVMKELTNSTTDANYDTTYKN